ncbi:MAG: hypothetical protein M1491_00100, partial [Deltaproteobacteria bacterium]|nr:hypothetical protein [Deltaproteobacteria bacterium]
YVRAAMVSLLLTIVIGPVAAAGLHARITDGYYLPVITTFCWRESGYESDSSHPREPGHLSR